MQLFPSLGTTHLFIPAWKGNLGTSNLTSPRLQSEHFLPATRHRVCPALWNNLATTFFIFALQNEQGTQEGLGDRSASPWSLTGATFSSCWLNFTRQVWAPSRDSKQHHEGKLSPKDSRNEVLGPTNSVWTPDTHSGNLSSLQTYQLSPVSPFCVCLVWLRAWGQPAAAGLTNAHSRATVPRKDRRLWEAVG